METKAAKIKGFTKEGGGAMDTAASLVLIRLLAHIEAAVPSPGLAASLSFSPCRHRERVNGMSNPPGSHRVTHGAPPFGDSYANT